MNTRTSRLAKVRIKINHEVGLIKKDDFLNKLLGLAVGADFSYAARPGANSLCREARANLVAEDGWCLSLNFGGRGPLGSKWQSRRDQTQHK
jgi:hypothetical protein